MRLCRHEVRTRRRCRSKIGGAWRTWMLAAFALGLAFMSPGAAWAALSFQLRTGNAATRTQPMVIDSNQCPSQGPTSAFVGGIVTNTGVAASGITATLGGLGSGMFLAGGQAATQSLGSLGAGESIAVFWFVGYGCTDGAVSTPTVTLASSAGTTATSLTLIGREAISANAGGNVSSASLGPGAVVGQIVHFDAAYDFGGTVANDEYLLQPAGGQNFNAACFRLVGVSILTSNINGITVGTADTLYFVQPNKQAGNGYFASARYTFQYLCAGAATTARPYAVQTSGAANVKYTGNFDGTGSISIAYPAATNPFTITKSVTPAARPSGTASAATYTVTVANPSPYTSYISGFVDTLPAGAVFGAIEAGSDVTAANSSSVPAAGATGTVSFAGKPNQSYILAPGGSVSLIYTATIPGTAGDYTNSAYASFGLATTPTATATLSVIDSLPLGVSKSSVPEEDPVNGAVDPKLLPGGRVRYAITVANPGAFAADTDTVIVTDPTPANLGLHVGDIDGAGSGPVRFIDGSPGSGLAYSFTALGSLADDIDFSSDGGATWTYVPVPDANGDDYAVNRIRIRPRGDFAPAAAFTLELLYRIN